MLSLPVEHFAALLPAIRPQLHRTLQNRYPCSREDAEDLVEEVVCITLERLDRFQAEAGPQGLLNWMRGILQTLVLRRSKAEAAGIHTVPIEVALDVPAPPRATIRDMIRAVLHSLPENQRPIVGDWLDGYSQQEIADRHEVHRNTVGNRLELAFETLRVELPDRDELTYDQDEIKIGSRVATYRKPKAPWRSWRRRHPRDWKFRLPVDAIRLAA